MERYTVQNTSELRKKLKVYGYRGYSDMDKTQLVNSVYIADKEHELYENFKPTPIDYSQYSTGRCNSRRYQRFISFTDKIILKLTLFSGIIPEIDFTEDDIEEYRWVAIYSKKGKDEVYIHTLLKLKNEIFVYLDIQMGETEKLTYRIAKDLDYRKIVNNIMTNEQYYWYRQATELKDQINMVRKTEERSGFNFSENVDNLIYLYFKFQEEKNNRVYKLQDMDLSFDNMKNFEKIYWIHLNLDNNEKSYILYKTKDEVYTLIKFKYNMTKIEDIPKGELNMVKVYLSDNYGDLISKALIHREYEMYMNETDLNRYF